MHLVCLIGKGSPHPIKPTLTPSAGPPASGKGALGKRLAEQFILAHVSVGDVLRAGRDSGRFEGDQETLSRIANSELLADEKIICILKEEIEKVKQEGYWGMILDGFPRSVKQAALFEEVRPLLRTDREDQSAERVSGCATDQSRNRHSMHTRDGVVPILGAA